MPSKKQQQTNDLHSPDNIYPPLGCIRTEREKNEMNMTLEEIIQGNKLIAEFMGYVFHKDDILNKVKGVYRKGGLLPMLPTELKYHSSWDWLMPVVVKCQSISKEKQKELSGNERLSVNDPKGWRSWNYRYIDLSTNIDRVWIAVVDFIKWYNSQK